MLLSRRLCKIIVKQLPKNKPLLTKNLYLNSNSIANLTSAETLNEFKKLLRMYFTCYDASGILLICSLWRVRLKLQFISNMLIVSR